MALVVLEHDPLDKSSLLGQCLRDHGHKLDVRHLNEGDSLPADLDDVHGVLVMGGSMNVDQEAQYPWLKEEKQFIRDAVEARMPVVGVCLGAQLIADALGGEVGPMDQAEVGFHNVKLGFPGTVDTILCGVPWDTMQFHAHGYEIKKLPAGAVPLSGSQACRTQAYCINLPGGPAHVYGFQYHFEWSRGDILNWLNGASEWLNAHDVDVEAIKAQLDEYEPMFRQLGDRVCQRLADLLYKIDKRLSHSAGTLTSFDPAVS